MTSSSRSGPPPTRAARCSPRTRTDPPTRPRSSSGSRRWRDDGRVATTYVDVDAAPDWTIGVLASRPTWMWGLEHGVNEAWCRGRQRGDLHHARPSRRAPPGAHRHGPRAARPRARPHRRGGGGGHPHAARPVRAGRQRAPRCRRSVLVVVPRRRRERRLGRGDVGSHLCHRARHPDPRPFSNRTTIPAFDAEHRDPGDRPPPAASMPAGTPARPASAGAPDRRWPRAAPSRTTAGRADGACACTSPTSPSRPPDWSPSCPAPSRAADPSRTSASARRARRSSCRSPWGGRSASRPSGPASSTSPDRDALRTVEADLAAEAPAHADDDAWAAEAWRRVDACLLVATPTPTCQRGGVPADPIPATVTWRRGRVRLLDQRARSPSGSAT